MSRETAPARAMSARWLLRLLLALGAVSLFSLSRSWVATQASLPPAPAPAAAKEERAVPEPVLAAYSRAFRGLPDFSGPRGGMGGTFDGVSLRLNKHTWLPSAQLQFAVLYPPGPSRGVDKASGLLRTEWTDDVAGFFEALRDRGWRLAEATANPAPSLIVTKSTLPSGLDRKRQLVNNIGRGNACLAGNKLQQLLCRRLFARHLGCAFEDLHISPAQWSMADSSECEAFFSHVANGMTMVEKTKTIVGHQQVFLTKQLHTEHGDGISFYRTAEQLARDFGDCHNTKSLILMDYVINPALIIGRKVDIRTFILIGSVKPYLLFYHDGYSRMCDKEYDILSDDNRVHITNNRNLTYFPGRFMDFEKLGKKLHDHMGFPVDHIDKYIRPRAQEVSRFVFEAALPSINSQPGRFQIYGVDWVIDDTGNLGLLEVNASPLMVKIPGAPAIKDMWTDTIDLVTRIHSDPKSLGTNMTVKHGYSFRGWKLLYNGIEASYEEQRLAPGERLYDGCKIFLEKQRWSIPPFTKPKNYTDHEFLNEIRDANDMKNGTISRFQPRFNITAFRLRFANKTITREDFLQFINETRVVQNATVISND